MFGFGKKKQQYDEGQVIEFTDVEEYSGRVEKGMQTREGRIPVTQLTGACTGMKRYVKPNRLQPGDTCDHQDTEPGSMYCGMCGAPL
jgi:hypothetical protein